MNCASSLRSPSLKYNLSSVWYPAKPRFGAIAFIDSTTSTGMRSVIEVMGLSFDNRAFSALEMLMILPFIGSSLASRNDADTRIIKLDMHDKQQAPLRVKANDGISRLVVTLCVHKPKQRVKKHQNRLLKRHQSCLPGLLAALRGFQTKSQPLRWFHKGTW
jgi:hypothetical protein